MDKQEVVRYYEQIHETAVLCRSCGMCAGVCPTNAITMVRNAYSQYIPSLNTDACIACGKCMRTCTARQSSFDKPSVMGPYRDIYLIRATDPDRPIIFLTTSVEHAPGASSKIMGSMSFF